MTQDYHCLPSAALRELGFRPHLPAGWFARTNDYRALFGIHRALSEVKDCRDAKTLERVYGQVNRDFAERLIDEYVNNAG